MVQSLQSLHFAVKRQIDFLCMHLKAVFHMRNTNSISCEANKKKVKKSSHFASPSSRPLQVMCVHELKPLSYISAYTHTIYFNGNPFFSTCFPSTDTRTDDSKHVCISILIILSYNIYMCHCILFELALGIMDM